MRDKFKQVIESKALYLVAMSDLFKNKKDFLEAIESSLKGGVKIVQLREKNLDSRSFYELGCEVQEIVKKYGAIFLINDRVDIALALKADGVHLGQNDLNVSKAREILGNSAIIGLSANKLSHLDFDVNAVDYLGVGAIFNTESKSDANVIGISMLKDILDSSLLPVFAIGGINKNNLKQLRGLNISGVAVVSSILKSSDILEATIELDKELKS